MSQSRMIIDFNRYFEPNPFNTGPAIPNIPKTSLTEKIYAPQPRTAPLILRRRDVDTPDLSNSPASSTSSASLRLHDEEIIRLFSDPRSNVICDSPKVDDLNPHARPFVPSFARGTECPSPRKSLVTTPGIKCSCAHTRHSHSHPPGIPFPASIQYSCGLTGHKPPPPYLAMLLTLLKPSTLPQEREILAKLIINSRVSWDIEQILELAEQTCFLGCRSGPDLDKNGKANPTCHPTRYQPVDEALNVIHVQFVEEAQTAEGFGLIAADFYRLFLELRGEKVAQTFAWNIREVAMMKFIQRWDCDKPASITYNHAPSAHTVRSALLLCKGIASLFQAELVGHEHISKCISVLLKDMMSVEHTEAVYNIVMGCGKAFWALDGASQTKDQLNYHVHEFITGMHANFTQKNLQDNMSVVIHPWCEGQLQMCLAEIVDNVRAWQKSLIAELG